MSDFSLHPVCLPLLASRHSSAATPKTEVLANQSYSSGAQQGLQAVRVATEAAQHAEAAAAGVLVPGEVVEEARENACIDQRCAWIRGV